MTGQSDDEEDVAEEGDPELLALLSPQFERESTHGDEAEAPERSRAEPEPEPEPLEPEWVLPPIDDERAD